MKRDTAPPFAVMILNVSVCSWAHGQNARSLTFGLEAFGDKVQIMEVGTWGPDI